MRIFSFLLAMFWSVALSAQVTCNIFDLTATVVDVSGCDYYVKLAFQHTGGTNQFTVSSGGVVVGTYPYSNNPVVVGPFQAAQGAATTRAFLVRDAVVQNCADDVAVSVPPCGTNSACMITDIKVEAYDCNASATAYKLWLDFKVDNPNSDFFEVWSADGTYLGFFPLGQLPLVIPEFPWNGGLKDSIKICIKNNNDDDDDDDDDNANCCKTFSFPAPPCVTPPACGIGKVKVETDSCTSDSTFSITVNFDYAGPTTDSFELRGNGQIIGIFPISSLPLTIPDFKWNKLVFNNIRIQTGNTPNCVREVQFIAPNCLPFGPCEVTQVFVQPGVCTSDSTYRVVVNFQATNPTNQVFTIFANGQFYGNYPITAVPLVIDSLPWNGQAVNVIEICMAVNSLCCNKKEFAVPPCLLNDDCKITDLSVQTGPCITPTSYSVKVNFKVDNPPSQQFTVFANGNVVGTYNLNQLPLIIPNFPYDGGDKDVIKICMISATTVLACCESLEFFVPDCVNSGPCEIFDLTVQAGQCSSNTTYKVKLDFEVVNPPAQTFTVFANGTAIGVYNLSQLPLLIPNFPYDGGVNDVVKVCINSPATNVPGCCRTLEFKVPDCLNGNVCEIFNLKVQTGACSSNTSYALTVNFQVQNPPSQSFTVFANGNAIGTFNLNQLPLTIPNFPYDGGVNDVIKVCMVGPDPNSLGCCRTLEFPVPGCLNGGPCEINDLKVVTGPCSSPNTYAITVNFKVQNPPAQTFTLWANGSLIGTYNLGQLPLTIPNFPYNGGANDEIKVCMVGPSPNISGCCRTLEFPVPDCVNGGNCEINGLTVQVGPCTSNTTYTVNLKFDAVNPPSQLFTVFANGAPIGVFNLNQLPLTIPNFPYDGGVNDVIKVCFTGNSAGTNTTCCETLEFPVPDCLNGGGTCNITDLNVETGPCNATGTAYQVVVKFNVSNPPSPNFLVFANGTAIGQFNINQLPLTIPNFPTNGGTNDEIKICFVNSGIAGCCKSLEFPVPDCLNDDCKIFDLTVGQTPCLCGQFFALVYFKFDNPNNGGVDILGNGQNYGTFAYNTPQPIILGPLTGDPNKAYEFIVTDHLTGDCKDDYLLGVVDCSQDQDIKSEGNNGRKSNVLGKLVLSPNPVVSQLNVSTQLSGGQRPGSATVIVYGADGRVILDRNVADAALFQLEVGELPSGVYRISVLTESGMMEGVFVK